MQAVFTVCNLTINLLIVKSTFSLLSMGCGSSSHPVATSSNEHHGDDTDDPNKHSQSGKN